jgi:hypothetical protein
MPSSENRMRRSITTSISAHADELRTDASDVAVFSFEEDRARRPLGCSVVGSPDLHSVGQASSKAVTTPSDVRTRPVGMRAARASRTAARTPSVSVFLVVIRKFAHPAALSTSSGKEHVCVRFPPPAVLQWLQSRLIATKRLQRAACVCFYVERIAPIRESSPRVLLRKCVVPMRAFNIPNGCSTVSRRRRIASEVASRRCCAASSRCSSPTV